MPSSDPMKAREAGAKMKKMVRGSQEFLTTKTKPTQARIVQRWRTRNATRNLTTNEAQSFARSPVDWMLGVGAMVECWVLSR